MIKDYHGLPLMELGASDIAKLVLRTNNGVKTIDFGGDGEYHAYFSDGEKIEIPAHYACIFDEVCTWAWIYDDIECTQKIILKKDMRLRVYRAGAYGCIIQVTEIIRGEKNYD